MSEPTPFPYRSDKEIFFEALDMGSPQARALFVHSACGANSALRSRVEALLDLHFHSDTFMREPAVEVIRPVSPPADGPAKVLGRYKLLEKIGEGGFGEVWMAEQREPVKRRVALKIIKPGMDSRQIVARFEAERQALAMMDHPNIASIFDADITDTGQPYFVMELVRGIRITDYCDENQLSKRARLDLFIKVCQAIQHAHQKGIIHRDIKPGNILVTLHDGQPVPKVIDFGIAKATQEELTEKTVFTQFHHFMGTPAYISPEQAEMSGTNVDTRADIYSLGILLYELLVGRTPFEVTKLISSGYDEMRRIIREVEPVKPSSRISTMAAEERRRFAQARHTEPGKTGRFVEPDLDWIVMKAIEKDRTRRYATAGAFAQDVSHFLSDQPVSAMPPAAWYKFRKFARRHKTGLRVAAAILAVLVAATVVSAWQAVRAKKAEQRARVSEITARMEAVRATEQKRLAEENLARTVEAEREATRQRIRADHEAETAQQNLFLAEMPLARQAWREHRGLGRMRELLGKWIPRDGEPDRRGWEWFYLNGLPFQNVSTLRDRWVSPGICTVAWHIPRRRLAEGTADGVIRIRDSDRGQTIRILKGPKPGVGFWGGTVMGWSPDGRQLTASGEGSLHVWEVNSGRKLHVLEHGQVIRALAYKPGGTEIAAWGGDDGRIKIWNTASGALTTELVHPGHCTAGAWSPDGKLLATGNTSGEITVSSPREGARIVTLKSNSDMIYHVEWSPDSSRLASTSANDFFVRVWDVASGKVVLGPLRHSHGITAMAWEPGGRRLATGSIDETVMIWNTDTGIDPVTLRGHLETITSLSWGPEGRLAAGGEHGSLKIWESTRDQEVDLLPGEGRATAVAWSPDGRRLASAGDDGLIRIRDPAGAAPALAFRAHDSSGVIPQFGLIRSLAWSPDGKHVASAGLDGAARIWDAADGQEVFALSAEHGPVWSVAWAADGNRLAVGSMDGIIRVVQGLPNTPRVVRSFPAHVRKRDSKSAPSHSGVRALAWSPRGDRLASGGFDQLVKLWDSEGMTPVRTLDGHKFGVLGVAWSPDGGKLASCGADNLVVVWDAATGQRLGTMRDHNDFVDAVVWSPDGTRLASAGLDNSVRIWDPERGGATLVLRGLSGMFHDVSWNADGARLAAASSDGQIRIWDATHGFERDTTARALPYIGRQVASGTARGLEPLWNAEAYVLTGKFGEAMVSVKDDLPGLCALAGIFEDAGHAPQAEATRLLALGIWERLSADDPVREVVAKEIAEVLLASGRGVEALPLLAQACALTPGNTDFALKTAALQAWFGDAAGYADTGRLMLRWAAESGSGPADFERAAKLASILPMPDASWRETVPAMAREGVRLGQNHTWLPHFKLALGMAEYRSDQYGESGRILREVASDGAAGKLIKCAAGFYQVMCLFRQGREDEARELFTATSQTMDPLPASDGFPLAGGATHDSLIVWMAFREAKTLLAGPAGPDGNHR